MQFKQLNQNVGIAGASHDSVDCNVGSPFAQPVDDINYMQNFLRWQNNPYSNSYNPSWNFSWSNNQTAQGIS